MTVYCPGCGWLVQDTVMAWLSDGRWLCAQCREVVCIHDRPIMNFCRRCREDYLAAGTSRMSGRRRVDWPH